MMEEEQREKVFEHSLPIFGIECFGSAIVDEGRFSHMTGIAPAPPVLEYKDKGWYTDKDWLALARHQLNSQPGAWISTLITASEKSVEKAVARFDGHGAPEIVANGLCELYGVLAPAMMTMRLVDEVLERRLYKIFDHVGIEKSQQESWIGVFGYPERKTESMKEREEFFTLAELVKKRAMERSMRRRIGDFARQYGYLGLVTPAARPLSFQDTIHRVSQLKDSPSVLRKQEATAREAVLSRATQFMSGFGLDPQERDAIKAYRDVAYWKLRQNELVALVEVAMKPGLKRLAGALKISQEHVLMLRVEELSHALVAPKEVPNKKDLEKRIKSKPVVFFVEDIVEVEW